VVGKQVDVVRQQCLQALVHPAGDAPALAAPEQAVVHQYCIGLGRHGGLNEGQAGGYPSHHVPNTRLALDLQTVGAVVFESGGCQQAVEARQQRRPTHLSRPVSR
jgi:hypothetical protein